MVQRKIKLGIFFPQSNFWVGGTNYFISLVSSLKLIKDLNFKFYIFCGKDNQEIVKRIVSNKKNVISSYFFQKKTFQSFLKKILTFFFNEDIVINYFLKKFKINIVSHYKPLKNVKSICWFPDFQHLFIKKNFSHKEIISRDKVYNSYIKNSNTLLVSSNDAKNHLKFFKSKIDKKIEVLNFVPKVDFNHIISYSRIKKKYNIEDGYFYIPNQFWPHKNHKVLIKVAKYLKKKNIKKQLILSGSIENTSHYNFYEIFNNQLKKNKVQNYFKYLGLIPYGDVVSLIYYSKALINPSFFEGWSTTVEEAKILDKKMILSNLKVHREQGLKNTKYFNPNNHISLAKIIIKTDKRKQVKNINELKKKYLIKRKKFGYRFYEILKKNFV